LSAITSIGDSAVLIPISAAILAWLLARRSFGLALWWVGVVALCAAATALLKVYFTACPVGRELTSPSGHTSLSALVFGAIGLFAAAECETRWQRLVIAFAAMSLIAEIAASRLMLGAHSPLEVGIGLLIGLTTLAIFARAHGRHKPAPGALAPLLSAVVLILLLLHGHELRAEPIFRELGRYLGLASSCI
jgi:hypothetical protein